MKDREVEEFLSRTGYQWEEEESMERVNKVDVLCV
jgi:hypothetical protein